MKLLFVNALYPTAGDRRTTGGAETFATRLVTGLLDKGHEVTVVRSGTTLATEIEHTAAGVPVHSMPCLNLYPSCDGQAHGMVSRLAWHLLEDQGRVAPAFRRVLDQVQPDLVHTNNVVGMTADVWRVARSAGVPILHTLHDYYLTCPRVLRFAAGASCTDTCGSCALLTRRRRQATRNVDTVVGVSQRMLDIHRAEGLFLNTPSQVILNTPPPRASETPMLPRPHGLVPTFGFIGRQAPEKGIFDLLAAFATLAPGTAKLLIAGSVDPAVDAWVARSAVAEHIGFTGYTTPEAFFPAIDVAVFPSLWEEPCSMGVGEAYSFGVPVLGSRRGGTPELLEDGRVGWLYQPGTGELATLMAHLAADGSAIAAKADAVRRLPASVGDPLVTSYLSAYGQMRARHRADAVAA